MRKTLICSAAAAALILAVPTAFAQSTSDQEREKPSHKTVEQPTQQTTPGKGHEERSSVDQKRPGNAMTERKSEETKKPEENKKGSATAQEKSSQERGKSETEKKGSTAKEEKGSQPTQTTATPSRENRGEQSKTEPGKSDQGKSEKGKSAETERGKTDQGRSAETDRTRADQGKSAATRSDTATGVESQRAEIAPAKQDKLREAVRKENVQSVSRVDFDVNVGSVVPPHYHFYPLPPDIIADLPEYRGDEYIVANNDILIVQPETHKIVYTLSESRSASNGRRPCD